MLCCVVLCGEERGEPADSADSALSEGVIAPKSSAVIRWVPETHPALSAWLPSRYLNSHHQHEAPGKQREFVAVSTLNYILYSYTFIILYKIDTYVYIYEYIYV